MGGGAKVTSLDALDSFATALRLFQDEALRAMESVEMNARAASAWTKQERRNYWRTQIGRAEQKAHEAKLNLQRAQTFRRMDDYRPDCVDEKREVERTRRRLEFCREKVEAVKHWSHAVDQGIFEYEGGVSQLARWLETEAERAVATLRRLRTTLQEYVAVAPMADRLPALDALPPDRTAETDIVATKPPADSPAEPPSVQAASDSEEEPT
jgi:hypothetical protein